jgi:phenylpyruvate tautomerase
MPLLRVDTTERLDEKRKTALCTKLSSICAGAIGKPESYMMVVVSDGAAMSLGGKPGPAAFVDVRSIGGLSGKVNQVLSAQICAALVEAAKVPADRVYLNFTSFDAADWGHDGKTFG